MGADQDEPSPGSPAGSSGVRSRRRTSATPRRSSTSATLCRRSRASSIRPTSTSFTPAVESSTTPRATASTTTTSAPASTSSTAKPYGFTYGAERDELDGNVYWRTTQFLFPIYGMFPGQDGVVPLSMYTPGRRPPHRCTWACGGGPPARCPAAGRRARCHRLTSPASLVPRRRPHEGPSSTGKFFANWWPQAALGQQTSS